VAGVLLVAAAASPTQAADGRQHPSLLDVPYVPQSEALCGGAAASMVLRYWGERAAAEDFASLVDRSAEGIATGVLVATLQQHGWQADAFAGDARLVQHHLASGRPVISLIEVRPGRFHYVVVIGWADRRVFFHDPAVRPGESVDEVEFDRRWAATRRWTLLLLPGAAPGETAAATLTPTVQTPEACDDEVAQGVEAARNEDFVRAESLLGIARTKCPASAAPLREFAGVRAIQQRWPEAVSLAERAVRLDPADRHAWHIVATGRFVLDDTAGALDAWNARGEPRVDLLRVEGLTRTRYAVVQSALALDAGALLTPQRLRRARRRIEDVPALSATRVAYTPLAGGLAHVDVAVVERPVVPTRWSLAAIGVHALAERHVETRLSSPTGGGERWDLGFRWWERRPKVSLGFAAPRVAGLPGVVRIDAFWERQAYERGKGGDGGPNVIFQEERRHVTAGASDWITPDVRWSINGGIDSFSHGGAPLPSGVARGQHVTLAAALEHRAFGDRIALTLDGARWWPTHTGTRFGAGRIAAAWRSATRSDRVRALARAGWHRVTDAAPLDLWPGAGVGHAREALLRAHPLLEDGVIRGETFGRTLGYAGGEILIPIARMRPLRLDIAAFTDVARASRPASTLHVDVGGGLRLSMPGIAGVFRADVARGLRDARTTFSIGWQPPWPGWRGVAVYWPAGQ
jgi:hypothetical protein